MTTFRTSPSLFTTVALAGLIAVAAALPADARQTEPRASGVRSEVSGRRIIIHYDLVADPAGTYAVSIQAMQDFGQTYAVRPPSVSGDVGPNVRAGTGKRIVWEATRDVQTLQLSRFTFQVSVAPSAGAQVRPPAAIGVRAMFVLELQQMAAKETFTAVLGSSSMTGFGGAVDITGLYKGLFARFSFTTASKDGSRVFVDDDDNVVDMNIPLTVKTTAVDIGGGWRLAGMGKTKSIVPYVGGGIVLLGFKETSQLGAATDDVSESFNGFGVFGGVDIGVGKRMTVGIEGQFRTIANAIGEGGVSEHFEETNLGGFGVRFMIGIKR